MLIIFYIFIFIVGACLGSFLCCQVRRAHHFGAKSAHRKKLPARSVCLACKAKLKWYDNIPIISWLMLKGKCRKCHKKIGVGEILAEVLTAVSFLAISVAFLAPYTLSLDFFPTGISWQGWAEYVATLALVLMLIYLGIYDAFYKELPVWAIVVAAVLATLVLGLQDWQYLLIHPFAARLVTDPIFAVLILGGIYLILYLVSKGKWVGDGDYLLATIVALTLGTPWLALVALFLANFLATTIMYPTLEGENRRKQKIPFGPFLVAACIITLTLAGWLETLI